MIVAVEFSFCSWDVIQVIDRLGPLQSAHGAIGPGGTANTRQQSDDNGSPCGRILLVCFHHFNWLFVFEQPPHWELPYGES
ncbi:MAG: hypothetical protein QE274_06600 [Verrucomicrobiaceae bacterium]|nr:hypothetical protein [Verrucomicrobiaceae bacterium]